MQETFKYGSGGDMTDIAAAALLERTLIDFLHDHDFDAVKLDAFTAHLDRMREQLDDEPRRDIADKLRRKPPGSDTVRLYSALFRLTGDLHYYERLLHYLALAGDRADPALIHYVYWCIQRQLFLGVAGPEKAASFAACDLFRCYESLVLAVADRWGLAPPIRPRPAAVRRVVLITNQFLGGRHQPSRDCFDFARRLRDEHKFDTLIINANLLPMTVPCVFTPPFITEAVAEYAGLKRVRLFDHEVSIASFTGQAFDRDKTAAILAMVERFNPDVVIGFGGSNIIADLYALNRARPTITIPTTTGQTNALSDIILGFDRRDWTADLPPLYRRPFAGRFRPFTFGYSLPPLAPERDNYALPQDKPVAAVVGTRLDDEATPDFIALLERILDRNADLVVAFAGAAAALPARLATSRHARRLLSLGHVDDIRSFYRRCAVFLNPPRQGGGGGAAYALAEGLPVVTHARGDAGSVAGPAFCVAHDAAYVERVLTLVADPAARAAAAETARRRFDEIGGRERATAELAAYCHEIIKV